MSNISFYLSTCSKERPRKKDPNVPDENWSWRWEDLRNQGYSTYMRFKEWKPLQREGTNFPVFKTEVGKEPQLQSFQVSVEPSRYMYIDWAEIPKPIKDEYYIRIYFSIFQATSNGTKTIFHMSCPDDPQKEMMLLTATKQTANVNTYKMEFTWWDTTAGTDPENPDKGKVSLDLGTFEINKRYSLKWFFGANGFVLEKETADSDPVKFQSGDHPLYKPTNRVLFYVNTKKNGDTYEPGAHLLLTNIGMGNSIDTAPPYP
ncbi:hypothetical protein [Pseudomonas phage vB_Pae-PA14]|nr:hypothetical protein [Pseudomonas phage vB_Pae-PA14]